MLEPSGFFPDHRLARVAGARIVLAVDDADTRTSMCAQLTQAFEVEAVLDGDQAFAACRRKRADLILSDIVLPRLDGLALLRALRADEILRVVPVILLAAHTQEEGRIEGLDAGAADCLVKPFSIRELVARASLMLELTRMRRDNRDCLQTYLNATSDVIFRMSPDWSELRYLRGGNLVAYIPDSTLSWLDRHIDPDDQPRVMTVVKEAIRTRSIFRLEHRVRRVDGTPGRILSCAIPLTGASGDITGWLGDHAQHVVGSTVSL